ncbi:hypothetical protein FQN57_001321 [Myotisia sp. PD_48]|nr:hypothetical protein FQN57_001321 [Myotisia sp. PD_48]
MEKGHGMQEDRGKKNSNGKPPLTHFLCLPLVNESSIHQLVDSLATFKSSIPILPPSSGAGARAVALGHTLGTPLVPYGALRPLGTLHLTLGVMSLISQERLNEATSFLQSLDLVAILREADREANPTPLGNNDDTQIEVSTLQPLTINLSSLHALPRARHATILHASPIDPTSRLYPFCVRLRNKFIDAGFMYCETVKVSEARQRDMSPGAGNSTGGKDSVDNRGIGESLLEGDPKSSNVELQHRPRPLLLHATIANTIYLGKKWNTKENRGGRRDGNQRKSTYSFDATDLLDQFRGSSPKISQSPNSIPQSRHNQALPKHIDGDNGGEDGANEPTREPFLWARNISIDRLGIYEMGAKPVPNDEAYGAPKLGEQYRLVAERNLDFA